MHTDKHRFKTVDEASCLVGLLCGAFLFLFIQNTTASDPLEISYTVSETTIKIGDPVELSLSVFCPTNGIVDFPELGREKEIVVLKRDWERTDANDVPLIEMRYTLTSFRLGEHVLSSNPIICRVGGEPAYTSAFPPIILTVETALDAGTSSELDDIKPMQKLPGRMPRWIWVALGTALTAFLVGLISSKLWKHRETFIPTAPLIPPHVIALRALEFLNGKGLLEKDEYKPFYTELSFILRIYLEGRFNLNAPDETTEEIIEELSTSPELTGTQRNILQDFMRQADMVKFAKGHPDRTTMESAFGTTKQFVEQTKLVGEAVPQIGNQKSEIKNSP